MNEFDYQQLENLIVKLVEKKVYTILKENGIESSSYGKIVAIDVAKFDSEGNISEVIKASVELINGSIINNMYNASGEILSVNDKVKIYGSSEDIRKRYIGIKCN